MESRIVFIGFGEAAMAFASGMTAPAIAYDHMTANAATRPAKLDDYRRTGVREALTNQVATGNGRLILSLVTADQALAAARDTARSITPGALFCDMNSVAPDTKRMAADAIERAGGRYVDVAIMAPVHPQRQGVPLLLSGAHAPVAAAALSAIGFTQTRIVAGGVGAASSIKMIRSVMVKGLEALTAEWILAAEAAGIRDEAIDALNTSWPGIDWGMKADYNLDRMMIHGLRRADEMEEVVRMLDTLGTGSAMTRATVERQRAIGRRAITPPAGLDGKLAMLGAVERKDAA